MGIVYKARQVNLNRPVALKMILAGQLAGPDEIKRCLRSNGVYTEAEASAQLDHPGIVPIFEVGSYDVQHYFSMAFVEGQSPAAIVGEPGNSCLSPSLAVIDYARPAETHPRAHFQFMTSNDKSVVE